MPPLTECKIVETDYDEDATVMHLNLSDIHGKDKIVNSVNCSMLDGFHIRSSFDKRNSFDKRSSFDSVDYESNDGLSDVGSESGGLWSTLSDFAWDTKHNESVKYV